MVDLTDPTLPGRLEIAKNLLRLFPESWKDESPSACEPMYKLTDEEFIKYSEKKGLNNLLFDRNTEECFKFQLLRRKMKVERIKEKGKSTYYIKAKR